MDTVVGLTEVDVITIGQMVQVFTTVTDDR